MLMLMVNVETCGNVNPEQIFNIIDLKVVDEHGELTGIENFSGRME